MTCSSAADIHERLKAMHFSELSQASQDCIINMFLDGEPGCEVTPGMKEEIREWAMTDDTVETHQFREILSHSNASVMARPDGGPNT